MSVKRKCPTSRVVREPFFQGVGRGEERRGFVSLYSYRGDEQYLQLQNLAGDLGAL